MVQTALMFGWEDAVNDRQIQLDCLLPTGVYIPLITAKRSNIAEIKEELWQSAQSYPLYAQLKDRNSYVFMCVNQMGEKIELLDENRRLDDIKPFQKLLKIVERPKNTDEKIINTKISSLIGKSLHELDDIKNLEVGDFRKHMRLFVLREAKKRDQHDWRQRLSIQFPPKIASGPAPKQLDNEPFICLAVQQDRLQRTSKQRFPKEALPSEVIELMLQKIQVHLNLPHENADDYILKVSGREEYLLGEHKLIDYKFIREHLITHSGAADCPGIALVHKKDILKNEPPQLPTRNKPHLEPKPQKPRVGVKPALPIKKKSYDSWDLSGNLLRIKIEEVQDTGKEQKQIYLLDKMLHLRESLHIRAGLYHGETLLCNYINTKSGVTTKSQAKWNEVIDFQISLNNVPRMTRLCFVLYALTDKRANKSQANSLAMGKTLKEGRQELITLAWVNITVFDYKGFLRRGKHTLYMWPVADDYSLSEELLNPLGSVEVNPSSRDAIALLISFDSYNLDAPVAYPMYEKVVDFAARKIEVHGETTDTGTFEEKFNAIVLDDSKASDLHMNLLRDLLDRDPLFTLCDQDKRNIWRLRFEVCQRFPEALPKLLSCVEWNNQGHVAQIQALLQLWPKLEPIQALQLLDFHYPDREVRKFAVKCLMAMKDQDLGEYMLQLVQAIKYESYLESDLAEYLLKRALENHRIGHLLFWLLRAEMHIPSVSVRFGVILEAFCRGSLQQMEQLSFEMEALETYKMATDVIRKSQFKDIKDDVTRSKAFSALRSVLEKLNDSSHGVRSTLDPSFHLKNLNLEKCHFKDSKMRPLWLVWNNMDIKGENIFFMYKNGDDLRQDMLTLQVLRIMANIWQQKGMDLRMVAYGCQATGHGEGLIQIVLQSETIANIQKKMSDSTLKSAFNEHSIYGWLKLRNPNKRSLENVISEFTLSCAGACVATYVLGIGDRHSDNIMLRENGQLFHIDFGHILGHFKRKLGIKRERVPFVLTSEFQYVIRQGSKDNWLRFEETCMEAYIALHHQANFIITLFMMMLNTGIKDISSIRDIEFLKETLKPHLTEDEARAHFKSKFEDAVKNSHFASYNFAVHNIRRDNK